MRRQPPEQAALTPQAVDYTRRLLGDVLEWYRSADLKSQILLTIDGIFLAFLAGSIFRVPGDLRLIVAKFGAETWLLLGLMALALAASIACAIQSLRSRGVWRRPHDAGRTAPAAAPEPTPTNMWFFEDVRRHSKEDFLRALNGVDHMFELEAVGSSAHNLASNVSRKHRWVNVGFVLTGATLLLFLGAAVSYLLRSVA